MAASPMWKVYDADGTYQAACKEPEAAAALVEFYGPGATVRADHRLIVARFEDCDGSYDDAAETMYRRVNEYRIARRA